MKKIIISLMVALLIFGIPKTAFAESKKLPITQYTQETGYYCGPAALKSALSTVGRGTWYSQGTLASWLGTTADGSSGTRIAQELTNLAGKGWYAATFPSINYRDVDDLWTRARGSIKYQSRPMVAGVYGKFPGFNSTIRHFVTIYGFSGTTASNMRYYYADPAGGRNHNIKYGELSASDLAYFIADGSIIW
ncbi:C39 family peptidase [Listeria booriae]|uniref:Peptidase C39-like domain-containing protein n=1 Tax=Listeria booriae TaxID=1552123 RepID=A0A7X0Y0E7_9LIST|nr:C39 family peptidase [Listeria booriae]MBC1795046.1 hypothetical protein [Listeria booriae]MBC1801824.1 hypothetical protein [Listeria booriae]MBC1804072.1 hypothetical protein [Listeria booriae]MBC2196121.1 hypothetical protein [Listeria booriae]MBC2259827.1 hypothetical protein [Listeria booriae]